MVHPENLGENGSGIIANNPINADYGYIINFERYSEPSSFLLPNISVPAITAAALSATDITSGKSNAVRGLFCTVGTSLLNAATISATYTWISGILNVSGNFDIENCTSTNSLDTNITSIHAYYTKSSVQIIISGIYKVTHITTAALNATTSKIRLTGYNSIHHFVKKYDCSRIINQWPIQ